MVKTIGNPGSWTGIGLGRAVRHVAQSVERIGGDERVEPKVQRLTAEDIRAALRKGADDFMAVRTDVMFICLLYPVIGLLLVVVAQNTNFLHLVFPMVAGFALLGPFAAIGLYEVSRRREKGEAVTWLAAMEVFRSPNIAALVVLGLYLAAIFVTWLVVAHLIWEVTLGPEPAASTTAFLRETFTTPAGWTMIVVGVAVGFFFALAVLATSVVSFPLLLDHNIGVPGAVVTSFSVFRKNPRVIATWGLVVAALLVAGSIPAFIGLIVVLPILGHATWHFYRRAIRV